MEAAELLGRWRATASSAQSDGVVDHAIEFTVNGEAIYSIFEPKGIARLLLVWRLEGNILVTDQPSDPREDRAQVAIGPGGKLELGAPPFRYDREDPTRPSDPEARLYALALFCLGHGVASASGQEPFIPFLVTENALGSRQLSRVLARDPAAAEVQARELASKVHVRCAWTVDGRVALPGGKIDAALVTASERGRSEALMFAQPYVPQPGGARRMGPMIPSGREPSWL